MSTVCGHSYCHTFKLPVPMVVGMALGVDFVLRGCLMELRCFLLVETQNVSDMFLDFPLRKVSSIINLV